MKKNKLWVIISGLILLVGTSVSAYSFISDTATHEDEQLYFEQYGKYLELKETNIDTNTKKRVDQVVKWNGYGQKEQYGYAIIEETDTTIKSTGYGDKELAKTLTYEITKPTYENEKPSSTFDF